MLLIFSAVNATVHATMAQKPPEEISHSEDVLCGELSYLNAIFNFF